MAAKPFWYCNDCRNNPEVEEAGGGGTADAVEVVRAMDLHNAIEHGIPLPAPVARRQAYRHYSSAKVAGFYDPGCA